MKQRWLQSIAILVLAAAPACLFAGLDGPPGPTDGNPPAIMQAPPAGPYLNQWSPPLPPVGPGGPDGVPGAFGPPGECSDSCDREESSWAELDFMQWWLRKKLPPLVTGNSAGPGSLTEPGTVVLFGGDHEEMENHTGARATAGWWFGDSPLGLEICAEFAGERATRFTGGSNNLGQPGFSRPVLNALTGQETAEFISFPGQFVGHIQVSSESFFWDGQTNWLIQLDPDRPWTCIIVGARYADLEEGLTINQNSTAIGTALIGMNGQFLGAPTTVDIADHFTTRNQFIGGQLGAQGQLDDRHIFLRLRGTLGVGYTIESATITGLTSFNHGAVVEQGGLLALPTNIGHFTHDRVTILPEGQITLGYHLTENIDIHLGYSIIYWSDLLRPVGGIDRTINPTQLATSVQGTGLEGPARPVSLRESDFWAHGLALGFTIRY
jgi:hypothetical protein